jgi:Homing endonuclease associated repeat
MPEKRPRGQRFDDVRLDIVWGGFEVLDEARKHAFLREAATELTVPGQPRTIANKVRRAIACLRDVGNLLGHSPSLVEYRRVRSDLPGLELLADGTLRRWLGASSWNHCLSRALLDAVSDGDFTQASYTEAFTEPELVAAVGEYMTEHAGEVPSLEQLRAWARDPEVRCRPGKRPLSWSPFARYGGYRAVLERGGFSNGRCDIRGRVLPTLHTYDEDELRAAVREVAESLGRSPRESEYARERRRILTECESAGLTRTLPTVSTLSKRFGPWPNVLAAAGLERPLDRSSRGPTRRIPRYSIEENLDSLQRAWVDLGQPFTQTRYLAWRREKLAEARERGEYLSIPSVSTICQRLGTWTTACREVLPSGAKLWDRRRGAA